MSTFDVGVKIERPTVNVIEISVIYFESIMMFLNTYFHILLFYIENIILAWLDIALVMTLSFIFQ